MPPVAAAPGCQGAAHRPPASRRGKSLRLDACVPLCGSFCRTKTSKICVSALSVSAPTRPTCTLVFLLWASFLLLSLLCPQKGPSDLELAPEEYSVLIGSYTCDISFHNDQLFHCTINSLLSSSERELPVTVSRYGHIHVCVHTHTHTHTNTHTHKPTHTDTHTNSHMHVHTRAHKC